MLDNKLVTINSRKLDGTIHKSWSAELLEENNDYFLLHGVFDAEIEHPRIGIIRRNTFSYEYYWKNKWFNIFRFHEPEGDLRNFYCNVNKPPVFNDGILDYVDLDIDLLIWHDRTFEILDMDEFEANVKSFDYSVQIQDQAYSSLENLVQMVEKQEFPFDYEGW